MKRRVMLLLGTGVLLIAAGPSAPRSFGRMYIAQCFSNKVFIVAPPFSGRLAPAGAISQPCSNAVAFDPSSGMMAVASGAVFGKLSISIYKPPYTNASIPAATFTPPGLLHPRQLAWDGDGDLWVSDDVANRVYEFRAPLSLSAKPAAVNTAATQPIGLAIDPVRRLMFIGDEGGARKCAAAPCRLYVIRAPYTGRAVAAIALGNSTPSALAVDRHGRLFVGIQNGGLKGRINVYVPPFASGQKAAFTLNAGDGVMAMAFDPAQNLYAQLFSSGGIVKFDGPVSTSMAARSVRLGCPAVVPCRKKNWAGLAFGP